MVDLNKIYLGDCIQGMQQIPDGFVDLVVTSPPYDNLREYNDGIDKSWGEHVWKPVLQQLYRVLKDGGVAVWVVGDASENFCESLTSFKQALYAKEIGFNVLDTMIYVKQNYAPVYPTIKRYANQFEYMFVFCKGAPKTFNPIRLKKNNVIHRAHTSAFRQKDGSLERKVIQPTGDMKDATNVWVYCVGGNTTGHPAVFPQELAEDHIKSWSNKGDVVLDPFMGSGTTALASVTLGRKFIGYELSQEYLDIANSRLKKLTGPFRIYGNIGC